MSTTRRRIDEQTERMVRTVMSVRPPENYDTVRHRLAVNGYDERFRLDEIDPDELRALIESLLPKYGRPDDSATTVDFFLEYEGDDDDVFVLPKLLARGDRMMVTGGVGYGKSTLVYQIGVQAASGIDPMTGASMPPVRVLYIDAENPRMVLRDRLARLRAIAGSRLDDPSRLAIKCTDSRPWNLADPDEFAELDRLVEFYRAELVILGPLYKLRDGDAKGEEDARRLSDNLDTLRDEHGCALLIEAHPSKESKAAVPAGAALWTQWPEVGLSLQADGRLRQWRPPRRDGVRIPSHLVRGGEWPWSPRFDPPAVDPDKAATDYGQEVRRFLIAHRAEEFARTTLATRMRAEGIKCRDENIRAALDALVAAGDVAIREDKNRRYYRSARGVAADELF